MRINNTSKSQGTFLTLLAVSFLFLNGTTQAADLKVRVLVESAEVRLRADTLSQVVGKLPLGTILESEGKVGEWFQVKLPPDEEGFVILGYIHQRHVEVVGEVREVKEAPEIKEEKPEEIYPPVQQPEIRREMAPQRKFYMKGIIGYGIGFEKVSTGYYKQYENKEDIDEVNLYPGGGVNLDVIFGYRIIPSLNAEIGIGYQSSGETAGDDSVAFHRAILTATLIHEFQSRSSIQFYIGGGPGFYFSPATSVDVGQTDIEIKYDSSIGFHGLAGVVKRTKGKSLFYFGEIKFVGLITYKWNTATVNGFPAIPTSKFRELSGNGIFINVGIGFSF